MIGVVRIDKRAEQFLCNYRNYYQRNSREELPCYYVQRTRSE